MNKTCGKCRQPKSFNDFFKNAKSYDGFTYRCKPCHKKGINKDKAKSNKLLNNYGITLEEYKQVSSWWDNKCAICEQIETIVDKRSNTPRELAVDHDHKDGTIRGVLCSKCNRGLGMFNDNKELLVKAARYLKNYEKSVLEVKYAIDQGFQSASIQEKCGNRNES